MNTHIISGSHRHDSQSAKVATYIQKLIHSKGGKADITELKPDTLPMWDERVWEDHPDWKKIWGPIGAKLRAADSLVIISPEYAGMASPALKNFFLFCTGDLIAHKPALLVGVSASMNGAYPIHELRASSYKNSRVLYIPDHVIIREAAKVLNEGAPVSPADEFLRKRMEYGIAVLSEYEKAMKLVRESKVLNFKDFANGM